MSTPTQTSTSIENTSTDLVASGTGAIADAVAKQLAEAEISRRTNALSSAVRQQKANRAELTQYAPDQVVYNDDGSIASSGFSKRQLEYRKSVSDRIDKLEAAISAALNDNNWTDLLKSAGY